jgi:hypothetical protein
MSILRAQTVEIGQMPVRHFGILCHRKLCANAFDLRRGILDVEAVLQAALLAFLHELKDIAVNLQIVVCDFDLCLDAAQLDVVARELGEA